MHEKKLYKIGHMTQSYQSFSVIYFGMLGAGKTMQTWSNVKYSWVFIVIIKDRIQNTSFSFVIHEWAH